MDAIEINFDGLIGPSHNYAGLSLGNVASASNAGAVSRPREAALQGLGKMRRLMDLGLVQGFLPPQRRPHWPVLHALGFAGTEAEVCAAAWRADPGLLARAMSASAMWTANAATVSPAADSGDGRCHLTIANLASMAHRSIEAEDTQRVLARVFADQRHFPGNPQWQTVAHDPLLEQAETDNALRDRLLLEAADAGEGVDPSSYRRSFAEALRSGSAAAGQPSAQLSSSTSRLAMRLPVSLLAG